MRKQVVCKLCYQCIMDCKEIYDKQFCENYRKGYSRFEYQEMIRQENLDLKRFCNQYGLKLNYLHRMLEGRMEFKYRYRWCLDNRLMERTEFLPYVEGVQN